MIKLNDNSYVIMKEIYFYPVANSIARQFSRGVLMYLNHQQENADRSSLARSLRSMITSIEQGKIDPSLPPDYLSFVRLATAQTTDAYRIYVIYLTADLKYEVLIDLRSNVFYQQYKATWASLPNKDMLT